jgi:hypothetical protein
LGASGLYFGHDNVAVEYTINGGPVQKALWSICVSSDCVGLWNGGGIPFVKSLFDKVMLRITINRSFAEPVYGAFSVAGAKEDLQDVGEKCGWLPKSTEKKQP